MLTVGSFGQRFSRSWEITKKTFAVMKEDKEILLFPILSSLFSLVLFLIFLFPFFLSYFQEKAITPVLLYASIFAFYFLVTFVAVFFNAGIVHIAKTRFEGGNATFWDGIKAPLKHLRQIIGWALLSATVGLILNLLESSARRQRGILGLLGRIAVGLLGVAWAIVSLFVVPAMVIKGYGPIDALKSSAQAVKKTWGESLIKYFGLGLVRTLFMVVGIIALVVPGILLIPASLPLGLALIGLFVVYFSMVAVIFSSASAVFDTALYVYAQEGKVPKFYSQEELSKAFVPSR